jgi:hypothetical protein
MVSTELAGSQHGRPLISQVLNNFMRVQVTLRDV